MSSFADEWVGVITDAGKDLIDDCILGQTGLVIDKVKTGNGGNDGWASEADMRDATALAGLKDESATIASTQKLTGGMFFRLRVPPAAAAVGTYDLREIGLFAKKQNGSTYTLLALFYRNTGISVPLATTFPDFAYTLGTTVAITNDVSVDIEVDATAVATMEDVLDTSAPEYGAHYVDETSTFYYGIGDIIQKDGKLYKANTSVHSETIWDASKWDECSIADAIHSRIKRTGSLVKTKSFQYSKDVTSRGTYEIKSSGNENVPSGYSPVAWSAYSTNDDTDVRHVIPAAIGSQNITCCYFNYSGTSSTTVFVYLVITYVLSDFVD